MTRSSASSQRGVQGRVIDEGESVCAIDLHDLAGAGRAAAVLSDPFSHDGVRERGLVEDAVDRARPSDLVVVQPADRAG